MISTKIFRLKDLKSRIDEYYLLLEHKPDIAKWLIEETIINDTELSVDAVIAFDGDAMVGNITLFHNNGIGLVGNVYLKDAYRGKGIGNQIMECLDDFAKNQNHLTYVLWVNPNKRPAAYNLYKKFGYIPKENTGLMIKDYLGKVKGKSADKIIFRKLQWKHFPELNLITSNGQCGLIITYIYRCYKFATFEMEFLNFMADISSLGWAIENNLGECLGAVFYKKDNLWEQQADLAYENNHFLFDVIIEDRYVQSLTNCSDQVPLPTGTITTFVESGAEKEKLYNNIFGAPVVLKNHLSLNNTLHDVLMYTHFLSKKS